MIDKIAYEFVKKLSQDVNFFDKWAGLVRPMRKKVQTVEKVFPVAINTPENCDQSDYKALVPDSSKKSIAYIEMLTAPSIEIRRHASKQMAAQLRLVVWYNLDRITAGSYVSEDILVDQVLDLMPHRLSDSLFNGVSQVHIEPTNITYGTDIVSQYTYQEVKSQFGTHPYGIFAIDLDVFYISFHCQNPIDNTSGCVTGKGNHETLPLPIEPVIVGTLPVITEELAVVGDEVVTFSGVIDVGLLPTSIKILWGATEETATNEIEVGNYTENGAFTIDVNIVDFGIDEIYWQFVATNDIGSDETVLIGALLNQIPEGAILTEDGLNYLITEDGLFAIAYEPYPGAILTEDETAFLITEDELYYLQN